MATVAEILKVGAPPIVAIIRGVTPGEVELVAGALLRAGIRLIEVPLNSPDPFASIEKLARLARDEAVVGAGTVLSPDQVMHVAAAGGQIIVSPHTDPTVIARAIALGLEPWPGFVSPTEAFAALRAGAKRLKLFPAGALGPAHLKAVREVLPRDAEIWPVGGAGPDNFRAWMKAGAVGIGVGGSLYRAGDHPDDVLDRARALVEAWRGWLGD